MSTVEYDQEYAVVPIGDLQEHPQNPNHGHEDAIDESIEENGWYGACIAQKSTGYILAGNHRYRVAVKRGAENVPVIYRDVDDETALRILLGDNNIARLAQMDEEALQIIMDNLESLDGTGYNFEAAQAKIEGSPPQAGGTFTGNGGSPKPTTGHMDPETGEFVPDSIPGDKYTPQFGVMVVCTTEAHQRQLYDFFSGLVESDPEVFEGTDIRVVAV